MISNTNILFLLFSFLHYDLFLLGYNEIHKKQKFSGLDKAEPQIKR